MTHENWTLRINFKRFPVVELGQLKPLLLIVGQPDTVPGIVVARVHPDGGPETGEGFLQLLDHHILVAEQGVSVCEVGINLGNKLCNLQVVAQNENVLSRIKEVIYLVFLSTNTNVSERFRTIFTWMALLKNLIEFSCSFW